MKIDFKRLGFWCVLLVFLGVQVVKAAPTTPTSDFIDNNDGTVTHRTTGLTWMRCAMGQRWERGTCLGTASAYTFDQAVALKRSFAEHSDWRLPNIAELQTIVERENYYPAINKTIFPNTPKNAFWSSSPYVGNTFNAWYVSFYSGVVGNSYRDVSLPVRLVRASQSLAIGLSTPNSDFTDNHHDGTVTHNRTGLVWQRCAVGQFWTGSSCSGTATTYTYDAAIALNGSSFANHSDWRVPNANELASIVKYDAVNPSINQDQFPSTPSNVFWSSSPYVGDSSYAWYVYFNNGFVNLNFRYDSLPVRLVRASQSLAIGPWPTPLEKHAVLLLHGMNSNLKTWNDLVNSPDGFDQHCANNREDDSIQPVANSEGIYCFRMNFHEFDRLSSSPTGLDGKTCMENNGCSGDYSTFNALGIEVAMAIKDIKRKLGADTKIILLGHSRGGLAARAFLQGNRAEKSNVVGLITTGTPHAGSPLGRYYFYLNDHCTPEAEHNSHSTDSICAQDWDFVNSSWPRTIKGLDIKAPTIGFLAEDSADYVNPYAIRWLNNHVGDLPNIKYIQIYYNDAAFGCLGGWGRCGYDVFTTSMKHPSQQGLNMVLNGREKDCSDINRIPEKDRNCLDGDGIVPGWSQQLSEVAGFTFSLNSFVIHNGVVLHTDEPKDIFTLTRALTDMYKSLQWIP